MFVVLISPAIPDHVRGYISRFLIEPRPNIFVGNCSPRVRDAIWERVCSVDGSRNVTLVHSAPQEEQGFNMWFHGPDSPESVDLDGLLLVSRPKAAEIGGLPA